MSLPECARCGSSLTESGPLCDWCLKHGRVDSSQVADEIRKAHAQAIAEAIAKERERCAEVADALARENINCGDSASDAEIIAAKIRSGS